MSIEAAFPDPGSFGDGREATTAIVGKQAVVDGCGCGGVFEKPSTSTANRSRSPSASMSSRPTPLPRLSRIARLPASSPLTAVKATPRSADSSENSRVTELEAATAGGGLGANASAGGSLRQPVARRSRQHGHQRAAGIAAAVVRSGRGCREACGMREGYGRSVVRSGVASPAACSASRAFAAACSGSRSSAAAHHHSPSS